MTLLGHSLKENPSVNILGPVDGAGAVGVGRGVCLQGIVVAETEPRAFLAFLVPEIAALVDAVSQVGDGADNFFVRFHHGNVAAGFSLRCTGWKPVPPGAY